MPDPPHPAEFPEAQISQARHLVTFGLCENSDGWMHSKNERILNIVACAEAFDSVPAQRTRNRFLPISRLSGTRHLCFFQGLQPNLSKDSERSNALTVYCSSRITPLYTNVFKLSEAGFRNSFTLACGCLNQNPSATCVSQPFRSAETFLT